MIIGAKGVFRSSLFQREAYPGNKDQYSELDEKH